MNQPQDFDKDSWIAEAEVLYQSETPVSGLDAFLKVQDSAGLYWETFQNLGERKEGAHPTLSECVKRSDPFIRQQVAFALWRMGVDGIPLLAELADDEDSGVRIGVAGSLGNAGDGAIPVLKRLARDPEAQVRVAVVSSLCLMRRGHRLLLVKFLFDKNRLVRQWAWFELGKGVVPRCSFLFGEGMQYSVIGRNARTLYRQMKGEEDWMKHFLD